MPDDTPEMVHKAPESGYETELRDVLTELNRRGISLHVSDAGTVLVSGYDASNPNPDDAAYLVAHRTLLNTHLAAMAPAILGSGLGAGLNHPIKAPARPPAEPRRRPLRPSPTPEEIAARRAERRAACRAAIAASQAPPPQAPVDMPTSGAGTVLGPALLPSYQVAAQARADRELRQANGGRRPVPVVRLDSDPDRDRTRP